MGGAAERAAAILDRAHRQSYHEEDGKLIVKSYQDVEPHMEYAAKVRREERERRGAFGKRPDFHRTMALPFNIILGAATRLGIPHGQIFDKENMRRITAELKRPEFKVFRTTNDKRI